MVGHARQIWAIEPNDEMRALAEQTLADRPGCVVVNGYAEATMLPEDAVGLITVAQAIHWFEAGPARQEFRRILRTGGWLAVLMNRWTNLEMQQAMDALARPEYGVNQEIRSSGPAQMPLSFYFGQENFQRLVFSFIMRQDWTAFLGGVTSASYMPDDDHPLFAKLEAAVREVFERFAQDGMMDVVGETELVIGQMI